MQYDLLHRCVTPQLSGCCFALLRFITTWRNEIDGRVLFSLKLLVQRNKKKSKDKRNHYSVIEQNVLSDNYMQNMHSKMTSQMTGKTRVWPVKSTIRPDIRELKNHDDGLVDDDRKWVTLYCASATSKFRRRGVVDDAKQSRITSSCNPQASAGINPLF